MRARLGLARIVHVVHRQLPPTAIVQPRVSQRDGSADLAFSVVLQFENMLLSLIRRYPPSLSFPEHAETAVKNGRPIASNKLVSGEGSVIWNSLDLSDKLIQDMPRFVDITEDAAFAVDTPGRLCKD